VRIQGPYGWYCRWFKSSDILHRFGWCTVTDDYFYYRNLSVDTA